MSYTLKPHQAKAVEELSNGKILVGDVGTGKSFTAASYYVAKEAPRDVVVITTAKKRDSLDWEKEFVRLGVGTDADATFHGTLIVDSWNNIARYVDVKDAFFVFDEQRVVGSGAWTKSFYKIAKANRWILLSATPGDVWFDYVPVFVANGFYKNKTEFVREHVVYAPFSKFPKVLRYLNTGKLVRLRNQLLVEMPMVRHTTRHLSWMDMGYDKTILERVTKDRWNVFENKPLKDVAELFRVARMVVNSDATRLEAVRGLMSRHPRLIVFYNFNYELELLRTLCDTQAPTSSEFRSRCDVCNRAGSHPCFPDCETSRINHELISRSTQTGRGSSTSSTTGSPSDESSGLGKTVADSTPSPSPMPITSSLSGQSFLSKTTTKPSPLNGRSTGAADRQTSLSTSTTTPSGLVVAEWNGHKHDPVPTGDRWVYLVQYTAGAEGWNCVTTDAMCFYSLTYSYRSWHQAFGRIDRMNTKHVDLYYYILCSKSWIDLAIRKALSAKKNFNESSFGGKF